MTRELGGRIGNVAIRTTILSDLFVAPELQMEDRMRYGDKKEMPTKHTMQCTIRPCVHHQPYIDIQLSLAVFSMGDGQANGQSGWRTED